MTVMEALKIYDAALKKFGINNQLFMLFEECGELLDVMAKAKRGRSTIPQIITELADVSIMVEQIAFFYGYDTFVCEKNRKLARLQDRLFDKTCQCQSPLNTPLGERKEAL